MSSKFSYYILPVLIISAVAFALSKKVKVFDEFISGAEKGLKTLIGILPTLVGLTVAVGMLRASGFIDVLTDTFSPFFSKIGFHSEVLPLALLSPLSGSGAMSIFSDVLSQYGADSEIGKIASVLMGSTETTFFAVSVYFGSVGIKNTRHTLFAGLCADFSAFFLSGIFTKMLL